MASLEKPIKGFLGLNLRDQGDRIKDNEFTLLQNLWQPEKGIYARRFGTSLDVSSVPICSRISGVWRHYAPNNQNISLYHCVPDTSVFPDNTVDLTLTEIPTSKFINYPALSLLTTGNIFGGGSVSTLRVCYSWIGSGIEQTYNSKNRAGFPSAGSFPMAASSNPAHQTITLGSASSALMVTVPAFPAGVRGANIFVARGTATEMTYMGTVTTSGGSLFVTEYIGPIAARADGITMASPYASGIAAGGSLPNGTYWISLAWVLDPNQQEGTGSASTGMLLSSGAAQNTPNSLGVTAASSATSGTLSSSTEYDFLIALVDAVTGNYSFVSTVQNVTTASGQTSVDITLPALPGNATPGSTFDLYFGSHGGTLYLGSQDTISAFDTGIKVASPSSGLQPGQVYNQGVLPTSGPTANVTGTNGPFPTNPSYTYATQVSVSGNQNTIQVNAPYYDSGASPNGAQACYVFIGTQNPQNHPMTCVGIIRTSSLAGVLGSFIDIKLIPSHNGQSCMQMIAPDQNAPVFWNQVNDGWIGGVWYSIGKAFQARWGFLLSKQNGSSVVNEVFASRTLFQQMLGKLGSIAFQGDNIPLTGIIDLHNFAPAPKTQNDTYGPTGGMSAPYPWSYGVTDPIFCYLLGMSYFANGQDIPWQTDGYTMAQLAPVQASGNTALAFTPGSSQTLLPPIPRFIYTYQNSLVVSGSQALNQLYASNANAPFNWATGGTGQLLRFVSIGDPTGAGVTAQGIFTPATEATNNPGSFMIGFKKNGAWMISTVPDPQITTLVGTLNAQNPSPMQQISARIGCTAYRTVIQTSIGTIFFGSDANFHLINRVSEPIKIGTKVQNLLLHLTPNDAYMRKCTAVYHNGHYKFSYPSPTAITQNPIVNDSELWLDLRNEGNDPTYWTGPMQGRSIGSQCVLAGDNDNLTRLFADDGVVRTGIADDITTLEDFGNAIVSKMVSKLFRPAGETHFVRLFGAILDVNLNDAYTNRILMEYFVDQEYGSVPRVLSNGGAIWDVSQWDNSNWADTAWQGFDFLLGETNITGRTFQFAMTTSDVAPFSIEAVTLLLKPEKRRILL